jgi:catechol 2,3-dioxygenase-like lactoylglutathione lyase family enzyme
MCLIVSDLGKAIAMWTDLMGFRLDKEFVAPHTGNAESEKLMGDILKIKGMKTKVALLSSPGGALIELQEPVNRPVRKTPREDMSYRHTGVRELGLEVDNIDAWYEKVRKAGYETQTDYVWTAGTLGRSFLFFDDDHNLIQLWQNSGKTTWV